MANISDLIEEFLLSTMGDENVILISRNQLAEHFDCAPSQINYVLSTRFTVDRGYSTDSKRGGGGYIEIVRLKTDNDYVSSLLSDSIGDALSFQRANHIVKKLLDDECITQSESEIILSAISDKSLATPFPFQERLRAQIFKNILVTLIK